MQLSATEAECTTCRLNRGDLDNRVGGCIYQDDLWVLEHAMAAFPFVGWLVLKTRRHVESFADLTPEEAASFGPLARRIIQGMTHLLNPEKIYLSMYGEAQGFSHLHVHLIPRYADTPPNRRGPHIFDCMADAARTGQSGGSTEDALAVVSCLRALLNHSE